MSELDALLAAVAADLGDPATWRAPVEFRDSLALCALNSAYSLRSRSSTVVRLLDRYRERFPDANKASGPDLLRAMDDAGGPEAFAREVLGNETKLPGTSRLRTVGIYQALQNMAAPEVAVTTAEDLRAKASLPGTRRAWLGVRGLGPASWSYLIMNAGVETETKIDVMVQRYLTRAIGLDRQIDREKAEALVKSAAAKLGLTARDLDRAIWIHESRSPQ